MTLALYASVKLTEILYFYARIYITCYFIFQWLYAFNITPQIALTPQQLLHCPGPATVSPYGNLIDSDDIDRNVSINFSICNFLWICNWFQII